MSQITSFTNINLSPSFSQQPAHILKEQELEFDSNKNLTTPMGETGTDSAESNYLEQLIKQSSSSQCIFFGEGSRPLFHFLSNDFPSILEFGGRNYLCATSAYEAQKFLHRPDLMDRFTTLDAQGAFALSAEKHHDKTPGWYEQRLETMAHVIRAKFGQNPRLASMLSWTCNAHLSYHSLNKNMDPFWTNNNDGLGQNKMGYLLMLIRGERGGCGPVWPPANFRDLIPKEGQIKSLPAPLLKSDEEILAEINDLNSRINEEEYTKQTQLARLIENSAFTRFKFNNFPYDKTRVPLSSGHFINANFLLNKSFIGTQSPMPHTNEDFWSMVLEHNVPIVIMLNRMGDPGDDIYFPLTTNDNRKYGNIHLELAEEPLFTTHCSWRQSPHEEEPHAIIHRKICIGKEGEDSRIVHHFQYQNWRDFSAGNERAVAHLVQTVNTLQTEVSGPVAIHCHAGVGRTSVMITLLEQSQFLMNGTIDIKRSVERQRDPNEGRCHSMMQARDQYHFCYRVMRLLSAMEAQENKAFSY